MATNTVEPKWRWWPVTVWTGVALLTATGAWMEWQRNRRQNSEESRPRFSRRLAAIVEDRWAHEAAERQILTPNLIKVRWTTVGVSTRSTVNDEGGGLAADPGGPPWSGNIVDDIAALGRNASERQVVLLGGPGSGKTVTMIALTLHLARAARVDGPAPILLDIGSWNPTAEPIEAYIAEQARTEYSIPGEPDHEFESFFEGLVAGQNIIPVLDGLDEIPSHWYEFAIHDLERATSLGWRFVVSCRSEEYARSGALLSDAVLVRLDPVDTQLAAGYLAEGSGPAGRWSPIVEEITANPGGPLAHALSTPLSVSLARAIFRSPKSDPRTLLSHSSATSVQQALLDGFITSAYREENRRHPILTPLWSAGKPVKARSWLAYLAFHLFQSGDWDLKWWRLRPGLTARSPAAERGVVALSAIAIGVTCVCLPAALMFSTRVALWVGLTLLTLSLTERAFRSMWPNVYRHYVSRTSYNTRWRRILHRLGPPLCFGVLFGFLIGVPILGALAAGAAGLACGIVVSLFPVRLRRLVGRRVTPRLTVAANFANAAVAAVWVGAAGAFSVGATSILLTGPVGVEDLVIVGVCYGLVAAYCAGLRAWLWFRVTVAALAVRGLLPWRFWSFVGDARRRGVIRQAGTVWQFRHLLLQQHLADDFRIEVLSRRRGDAGSAAELADLLAARGQVDKAVSVLGPHVRSGNSHAILRCADVLAEAGKVDAAIALLREHRDGPWFLTKRLAVLLSSQDRVDEAAEALRTWAPEGMAAFEVFDSRVFSGTPDDQLNRALADLFAAHGRTEELRARADDGDSHALRRLVECLVKDGDVDEATGYLRARVAERDGVATGLLCGILTRQGRRAEAIELIRPYAERGDDDAITEIGDLLIDEGRTEEAVEILRRRADAGNEWWVADFAAKLANLGRIDEAIETLRARFPTNVHNLTELYAELLARDGRLDELAERSAEGDSSATTWLARALAERGDVDGGVAVLRAPAREGDHNAIADLADLLADHGRVAEAMALLRPHVDEGDSLFVSRAARMLAGHGRAAEALALLRPHLADSNGFEARQYAAIAESYSADIRLRPPPE